MAKEPKPKFYIVEGDKKTTEPKLIIEKGAKPTNKKRIPIEEYLARMADRYEEEGEDGSGKIVTILRLWKAGYTRSEIVKAGFNRSTVYRQVGEYEKLHKAPATSYMGFELYEGRVQRIMKKKGYTRDQAVKYIAEQDIAND